MAPTHAVNNVGGVRVRTIQIVNMLCSARELVIDPVGEHLPWVS